MTSKGKAIAHPNIALVKYWGKRDVRLNLPERGSISMALDSLWAVTEVEWREGLRSDCLWLNGREEGGLGLERAERVLERVRSATGEKRRAKVSSRTNFPPASGLASSSAGFAALAVAAAQAVGWEASEAELSTLARLGSGSACRSVPGGFAEWRPGRREDGEDSYAVRIPSPDGWHVRMVVAIVTSARKPVSSGEGMERTAETSPFYAPFVESIDRDLGEVRDGLRAGDLGKVGAAMERSSLRMHAAMLACDPPLFYWLPVTVALIHKVRELREAGTEAYFTIDAGPHVKAICRETDALPVRQALAEVPGVEETIVCAPADSARRQ